MPRAAKAARLWLRPAERKGDVLRPATWIILDHGKQHRTGLGAHESAEAERRLAEHIAAKRRPAAGGERHPAQIPVSDVLSVYMDDRPPFQDATAAKRFAGRMERLIAFHAGMTLAEISARTCQDYSAARSKAKRADVEGGRAGGPGGARRDLEDLRAAIAHHANRRLHVGHVETWLPEKGEARDVWLTRDQAARLLWTCWRARHEQRRRRNPVTRRAEGAAVATAKHRFRHIARFILIGLYTGTRAAAIAAASYQLAPGRSYVDLDTGVFFRRVHGRRITNKRQPAAPLPPRLVAHMRRWKAADEAASAKAVAEGRAPTTSGHVVEYNGRPIASVKFGFAHAVELAGLPPTITPHALRHTAATWLMQNSVSQFDAAGFLGMSPQTLDRVYAHQDQRHLRHVADAIARKPARNDIATKRGTSGERKANRAN